MSADPTPNPLSSPRTTNLSALPLFAQALVACRLARRAVLAMLSGEAQKAGLAACDDFEAIIRRGSGWHDSRPALTATARLSRTRETEAALDALRWANDSTGAAQGANDFPVDAIVGASARRCIDAVCADRRVSRLQIAIILESDIDQIAFACGEAHVGTYDPLTDHVFERLAPCHAFTLSEVRRTPEDDCR